MIYWLQILVEFKQLLVLILYYRKKSL